MYMLVVRRDREEQMVPNWHLCCPGVYSAEKSRFAVRLDAESETPLRV